MKRLDEQEISLVISKLLGDIIEKYPPYQWVKTVESFPHPYQFNKVSYDYSGDVEPMTKEVFQNIVKNLGAKEWYSSSFEELLHDIHINQWKPTFISNCGKDWISYHGLLQDAYDDWKYEHFELYDEDGNELDENFEIDLNNCLYRFLEYTSPELYVKKILKRWWG